MENTDQVKSSNLQKNKHESFWHFTGLLIPILIALWYLFGNGFEVMSNYFGQSNWFVLLLKFTGILLLIYFPIYLLDIKSTFDKIKAELVKGDMKWFVWIVFSGVLEKLIALNLLVLAFIGFAKLFSSFWWIPYSMIFVLLNGILFFIGIKAVKKIGVRNHVFADLFFWIKEKTGVEIKHSYILNKKEIICAVLLETRELIIGKEVFDSMTDDEIKGIVLHEAGHLFRRRFVLALQYLKRVKPLVIYFVIALMLESFFGWVAWENMSQILVWYILIDVLSQIVIFIFDIFLALWMRHEEYLADEFAVRNMGEKEAFISALNQATNNIIEQFGIDNTTLSPLSSHPPISKRIDRINKLFP